MKCFPAADTGWRVKVDQENHPLSEYEFDVLIGADGKRNTLQGETLYNVLIGALYGGTCVIYLKLAILARLVAFKFQVTNLSHILFSIYNLNSDIYKEKC